jgi:hypothetical protein
MPEQRARLVLELVDRDTSRGFVVAVRQDGSPSFQGSGPSEYACGRCARLLATGVHPGVFACLVFRCRCGAMNRVPVRPGLVVLG